MWSRVLRAVSCFVPVLLAKDVSVYEFNCPFCGRVSPVLVRDRYYAPCLWCCALVWLRLPGVHYPLGIKKEK